MTMQTHSIDIASMEDVVREHAEDIQKWSAWLWAGKGDGQAICRNVMGFSIWNGCATLVLGRDEAEALRYFRQALGYGLIGLGAPGSRKGLRCYDVLMEIDKKESRIIHEHERRSSREPAKISIADYNSVLKLAVCFGDRAEMEEVARYPEERYRNPNVVAGEDFYAYLDAWKQLLLGDDARAKQEMQEALTEGPNAESRHDMEAFVALLEKDEQGFRTHVEARLTAHRKRYKKQPADPGGIICFPVLMLCRTAIDRGVAVEAWPYVPLKLLPNYKIARAT